MPKKPPTDDLLTTIARGVGTAMGAIVVKAGKLTAQPAKAEDRAKVEAAPARRKRASRSRGRPVAKARRKVKGKRKK